MNERFTRHVLSEARRSLEPSNGDRELILKRVLMTAAAASVAGGAAAAAKASGVSGLVSTLLKGATVIKLGAAFLMVSGGVALWMFTMGPVSLPPATDVKSVVSTAATTARDTVPDAIPDPAVVPPEPADMPAPQQQVETVPAVSMSPRQQLPRHHDEPARAASKQESPVPADGDDGDDGDDALYREISAMKHASAALRNHNPDEALRILDNFEKSEANGVMAEEREGIRVLALCATGPSDRATAAEKRFLAHAPNSPMAARIRRACAVKE